jgi:hypothetical protein
MKQETAPVKSRALPQVMADEIDCQLPPTLSPIAGYLFLGPPHINATSNA